MYDSEPGDQYMSRFDGYKLYGLHIRRVETCGVLGLLQRKC